MTKDLELRIGETRVVARESDRYVPATALCKAAKKQWNHYWTNAGTKAFVDALSAETGIPGSALVQVSKGGNARGGTWIHPRVVIHFAQWVSPEFAVQVTGWVVKLLTTGRVELGDEDRERIPSNIENVLLNLQQQSTEVHKLNLELTSRIMARVEAIESRVSAAGTLPFPVSATPRFTVQQRLDWKQWHNTSRAQRRKIYQLAVAKLDARHDETPDVAGGPGSGGPARFYGHQLACLDEAIDEVREYYLSRDRGSGPGLFPAAA